MASSQQVSNVAQFKNKAKAPIAEAMSDAKSLLAQNNVANDGQYQPVVSAGAIKNTQKRPINLYQSHNFRGEFVALPHKEIDQFQSGAFLHQGQKNLPAIVGSKGAVIYSSLNSLREVDGWLLAWDNPDHLSSPVKVYVEAGNLSKFQNVDWNEIERKLDASSDESFYGDLSQVPGPGAYAKIEKLGDKFALIGANFLIIYLP